jgi:deoxycytidine triphosphate deaminase
LFIIHHSLVSLNLNKGNKLLATILNDVELRKLLGTIIIRGDEKCLRPNSYILRVGTSGEYLNTSKAFDIDEKGKKKGISIPPGHSVGLISHEDIDFRREIVQKIFPNCDLHAFITPTTNLSREGIVAPATQIDAGWNGTLNWTVVNTSNQDRRYLHKSKVFRMTVLKLTEDNEIPENPYDGHYQGQFGYVKSKRRGAPVGMSEDEWEKAYTKGGPEDLLQILAKSGPPWNVLSERMRIIDHKFEVVTNEYDEIKNSIEDFKRNIEIVKNIHNEIKSEIPVSMKSVFKEERSSLRNEWLVCSGAIVVTFSGILWGILSNQKTCDFFIQNGPILGPIVALAGIISLFIIALKK